MIKHLFSFSGSFGDIYMGENLVSNPKMQVAIKIEPTCDKAAQLYNEFKFYRLINEKQGFPNIYWFGQWDKYNVLVMVSWPEFLTICFTI